MKHFTKLHLAIAAVVAGSLAIPMTSSSSVSAEATTRAGLRFVGRWTSGKNLGGAEISAYDPASKRMFVTNGATNMVDIVDISKPATPKLVSSIDLSQKGVIGIQSVATQDGVVAIAASLGTNQLPGKVFLTDIDGKMLAGAPDGVAVGSLPDHVSFTPDGRYVLSANEGEPSSYCKTNGVLTEATDPKGTVSIIDVGSATPVATTVDFSAFDERAGALGFQGGRVFGPGATLAQDVEPEYITYSADSKFAYVGLQENNTIATIDMATKTVIGLSGLGFKNHSLDGMGLDAVSNATAKVAPQSVSGMYQPDGLATLTDSDGTTYVVSANEGDARSYPCLLGGTSTTTLESEDSKLSAVYDSTDSAITAVNAAVGSLVVTPFAPANARALAITSSTKVKTAYSFGARSFSVWKPTNLDGVDTMTQVWDSGNQLETITAARNPLYYNSDWNTTTGAINAMESRSTKKGPEPEGVAVGMAYGRTWIVVGMEREGGIVLYDGTYPASPAFVDYINTGIPTGNVLQGTAGDVSPEGIEFISPEDSPTGNAMILVSYELSGTVGIYEIPRRTPSAPRTVRASAKAGTIALTYKTPTVPGWASVISYTATCTSDKGTITSSSTTLKMALKVPAAMKRGKFACKVTALSQEGSGGISRSVAVVAK